MPGISTIHTYLHKGSGELGGTTDSKACGGCEGDSGGDRKLSSSCELVDMGTSSTCTSKDGFVAVMFVVNEKAEHSSNNDSGKMLTALRLSE